MTSRAVLFDLFGTLVDERGKAAAGAARLMHGLPRDRWGIVTSCANASARSLLARAHLPVPDILIGSDDVRQDKPSPEGYLQAAKLLNVSPADCVAIEDSLWGVMAARAAGMSVIALSRQTVAEATNTVTCLDRIDLQMCGDSVRLGVLHG